MTAVSLLLKAIAEIGVILFLIWGFINQNKFVRFEKKILGVIKTLRKKRREARNTEWENELAEKKYASEYETERRSSCKSYSKRKSGKNKVA